MNWQELINDSEIIYSSTEDDKNFRTWSLKSTTCNVLFYEDYPVDKIDEVVCGILDLNNGYIEENRIATMLGFNVVDNFEVKPKRYKDKAELDIFRAIIKSVFDWGLIEQITDKVNPTILKLTDFGYRALSFGIKYKFYSGSKQLLKNSNINPIDLEENIFFPFFAALGEFSEIKEKKQLEYKQIDINEVLEIEESDLIKCHKLQSKEHCQIFKSELTNYFKYISIQVDIRIYKKFGELYPIIFSNNQISIEPTDLLNRLENIAGKEKKIEWGLYLKLIKDPNAVLDYETIIPFEDLLELDTLVKDSRLSWDEKQLFSFIAERANANQWFSISNNCPIDVLKQYLKTFSDKFDWSSLSLRIDDDFLIQNATKFPWNFEVISAKEDISIEVIKTLLLIPKLKEHEWDWDKIMPQLSFEFIKSNIDTIDFELSEQTKTDIENIKPLIVQYPTKRWDWLFISTEYDLPYILDNILNFSNFLNLKNVINRAFISENDIKLYCQSSNFVKVLLGAKDSSLRDYQTNQAKYFWTEQLINLLESTGYLTWESGNYISGFECNPFITWSADFFKKYHLKIETQKGFDFVSAHILDSRSIIEFPDFNWNWDIISKNANLIIDTEFLLTVKDKLNFSILLTKISGQTLEAIFDGTNMLSYLGANHEHWNHVTQKSSKEFVLQNIDYNWDWQVLTERFSSSIKIESLGNPKWINKWDWKYLTISLDLSIVTDKLDLYLDYWDWDYLSLHLEKDFILKNLPDYNDFWNWDLLLKSRFEKSDLHLSKHLPEVVACISTTEDELKQQLWKIITCKFDYDELANLISQTYHQNVFQWDYTYFYDIPSFNPRQYLNENIEFVEWKSFSGSRTLNKSFRWDKSLFSYEVWLRDIFKLLKNESYQWNFNLLSTLDSINWNDSILSIKSEKWDWEYLSQYSSCFRKDKDFSKRFKKFSSFITFNVFSKRIDSDITEELITDTIDKDWNWACLSENFSVKISIAFIKANKEKSWKWGALSNRNDIKFENDIFLELSNKNWDWEGISNRTDITFCEELINKLQDKQLNWYLISQSKTFVPNAKTLSILRSQNLDWKAISRNENLSMEILWDYRNNLDWQNVTKNQIVSFSDVSFLSKYQDYINWDFISRSEKFMISIENLKLFKDKLNWIAINSRNDFSISKEHLEPFSDVLNWSNISKSMEIQFTEELIEKYRHKWDWQLLRKNPQIIERLATTLSKYRREFNCVEFLEQFDRVSNIYHFTHLFHAIDIIKERKILSRNKGVGKFTNSAGNLVDRRDTAHNFARFYYRPMTPTQFYNECLGQDSMSGFLKEWFFDGQHFSKWKTNYPQARNLGLPKCPLPVFFKFDLKEVIMKMGDKCYYSTGNMQTNWARVEKVSDNPNAINTDYLYSDINDYENYKQYSQQEFLVEEEFDFSKLNSFEIICFDNNQVKLLKELIGETNPICNKINSNGSGTFHRGNRNLRIDTNDDFVSIHSEYKDSAFFSITYKENNKINIIEGNILKEEKGLIIAYPNIKFSKSDKDIEVKFCDESNREWLIYKN